GDIGEATQMRELFLDARREQALVNADILNARRYHLLVALVGHFLVVHAPRITADVLVSVVADRIALAGLRLEREASVWLAEQAGLPWREDHVTEHTPGAGLVVDFLTRLRHLLVG